MSIFEHFDLAPKSYAEMAIEAQKQSADEYARAMELRDQYNAGRDGYPYEIVNAQNDAAATAEQARLLIREVLNGRDDDAPYVLLEPYSGRYA